MSLNKIYLFFFLLYNNYIILEEFIKWKANVYSILESMGACNINIGSDGYEKDSYVVVETEKGGELAAHSDYKTIREATYGKTVITVLARGDEE